MVGRSSTARSVKKKSIKTRKRGSGSSKKKASKNSRTSESNPSTRGTTDDSPLRTVWIRGFRSDQAYFKTLGITWSYIKINPGFYGWYGECIFELSRVSSTAIKALRAIPGRWKVGSYGKTSVNKTKRTKTAPQKGANGKRVGRRARRD